MRWYGIGLLLGIVLLWRWNDIGMVLAWRWNSNDIRMV